MEMSKAEVETIRRGCTNALVVLESLSLVSKDAPVIRDLREALKITRPRSLMELTPR